MNIFKILFLLNILESTPFNDRGFEELNFTVSDDDGTVYLPIGKSCAEIKPKFDNKSYQNSIKVCRLNSSGLYYGFYSTSSGANPMNWCGAGIDQKIVIGKMVSMKFTKIIEQTVSSCRSNDTEPNLEISFANYLKIRNKIHVEKYGMIEPISVKNKKTECMDCDIEIEEKYTLNGKHISENIKVLNPNHPKEDN